MKWIIHPVDEETEDRQSYANCPTLWELQQLGLKFSSLTLEFGSFRWSSAFLLKQSLRP